MQKILLSLTLLLFVACGPSAESGSEGAVLPEARTDPAPAPAPPNAAKMTPIFHAAVVLEYDGKTIFIDPYDDPAKFSGFSAPDLVLVTHTHQDHFNRDVLSALDLSKATLVGPAAVTGEAGGMGFAGITTLANGESTAIGNIGVTAVAAYNLPPAEDAFHPPGKFNGYVVDLGGERYYFSGDTEDVQEMRDLENIDYAFICMNLPYTMPMDAAADAVLEFKPRVVYPYHYRNKDGTFMDTEEFARLVREGDKAIEVRVRDWYK